MSPILVFKADHEKSTLPLFWPKLWSAPFGDVIFGSAERRKPRLISHEIIFEVMQPM